MVNLEGRLADCEEEWAEWDDGCVDQENRLEGRMGGMRLAD